jgi:hypothetical protein
MRWIRGTVNAILVATLIRPVARRLIARTRRRAREHPVAPLMIPAEELFETALLAELGASLAGSSEADIEVTSEEAVETIEEIAGRSTVRTLLLLGLLAAAVASAAWAVATIVRRRRQARTSEHKTGQDEWVAVPVDTPSDEPVEAAVS